MEICLLFLVEYMYMKVDFIQILIHLYTRSFFRNLHEISSRILPIFQKLFSPLHLLQT